MTIVVFHWVEHLTQAYQVWVLGWPRPHAMGFVGLLIPWLMHSEWLHYGFAVAMYLGMWALIDQDGITGRASGWWRLACWLQTWHLFEHSLLLVQAQLGVAVPVSIIQLWWPRIELHLFYNTVVTVPMLWALWIEHHTRHTERSEFQWQPNG
jgi:hypothetical protein